MAEKGRRFTVKARRWITVAGTIVVLGGGAGAWAATRPSDPPYRLTAAGPAEVSSVLSNTGTIQSVNQATLSFPVSGQVSAVNVQVGQQVTPGQVVATLDTTNLATQVSSAQSRAAAAQAKLATDENSQTAGAGGGSAASGGGSAASGGRSGGAAPGGGKPTGPSPAVKSGQTAVKNAQHQVDADLAADNTTIGQEKAACAQTTTQQSSYHSPSTSGSSPTTSTSPTTSSAPPSSSSGSGDSGGSAPTADCTALIQRVLGDQTKTASDEQALADAENGLTTALDQAAAPTAGGGSAPSAPSGGSPQGGGAKPPSGAGGKTQAPASAAQLAADQASVDSTNADLAAANQNLSAATLTSPIAGTVAQVGVTTGQTVAGASTQADIVIIGPGSDEVTTTVTDTQVGQVHTGQTATITPDGTNLRLSGQVTQVGILGSSSSSGGVTYPVTISLDQTPQQLFAGATAAVSINTGAAHAAVAVPTSAVHTAGARRFVTVLRNGQITVAPVTVGVVGATLTEIRSGLRAGDQVVIANLKDPLPTSNTGLRGFGGGGGGAGGAGGARPGGGGAGAGGGARGGGG
jgi:multidrug efflux pump subunit AcrA (membrane-fusion protein)